jgi:hypothetical protein
VPKAISNPLVSSYTTAHCRVYRARGRAEDQRCVDCNGQACQWSYDHTDPDELVECRTSTFAASYSLNPEYYSPRCTGHAGIKTGRPKKFGTMN